MGEDIFKKIPHKRITSKIYKELTQHKKIIQQSGRSQGRRIKGQEFTATHKYIKYTWTNGKILRDHLLNTSGRPWKAKTRKIATQPGRTKEKKKKKKKRKWERTSTPGRELKVRRNSHSQKSPFTARKPAGQKGALGGLKGNSNRPVESMDQ